MSSDMNKAMDQLKEMLGNENMVDNLQTLLGTMLTKNNGPTNTSDQSETEPMRPTQPSHDVPNYAPPSSRINLEEQMDIVMKIKKMYDRINSVDDPRINLLNALKPYLNEKRLARLDSAIKVINISKISTIVNDIDIK